MPKHDMAKEIEHLKDVIKGLEARTKAEGDAIKKAQKAHKAEGKKVHAKRFGKAGREKLRELHAAETAAIDAVNLAHLQEIGAMRAVKKAVPKVKGAPVDIMRSAEAKPEAPVEKRPRGRPRTKPGPVVDPGLIPAALAGGAPETGPQETAKAPKAKRAYKRKTARDVFMSAAEAALAASMPAKEKKGRSKAAVAPYRSDIALLEQAVGGEQPMLMEEKKPRKPRAKKEKAPKERKPRAKKGTVAGLEKAIAKLAKQTKAAEELVIKVPPMPKAAEAPKEKKARKPRKPMTPEQKERAKANLAKARAARKAKKEKKED